MSAEELANILRDLVDSNLDDEAMGLAGVQTFEEALLMTSDFGLVVRADDGSEFQVTIVRSR